jgi:hypothetical protein
MNLHDESIIETHLRHLDEHRRTKQFCIVGATAATNHA